MLNEEKNPLEEKLPNPEDQIKQIDEMTKERESSHHDALLHTYSNDIAQTMKDKNGSIMKIAIAEQERKKDFEEIKNPKATKNALYIFFSFFLILFSVILVSYVLSIRTKPVTIQSNSGNLPSLIFTEKQVLIDASNLSHPQFVKIIKEAREQTEIDVNTILNIFITEKNNENQLTKQTSGNFIELATNFAPDEVIEGFGEDFTLGTHKLEEKDEVFILFKIKDYDKLFEGMKKWEGNLLDDTIKIFNYEDIVTEENIFEKDFTSEFIENKESRVLRKKDGSFLVGYIFINNKTLLITSSVQTAVEVIRRLETESLRR